jgi:hypothetical protein
MPRDEDEDLYEEEFDFVDEDESDEEEEAGEEDSEGGEEAVAEEDADAERGEGEGEEEVDEYGRPAPQANYVVHIYEHKKFKRTIDRAFTPEDAEAFATEFNRTSKNYGRVALAGKNEAPPRKSLEG